MRIRCKVCGCFHKAEEECDFGEDRVDKRVKPLGLVFDWRGLRVIHDAIRKVYLIEVPEAQFDRDFRSKA